MKKIFVMMATITTVCSSLLHGGLLPDYDKRCDAMKAEMADIRPHILSDQEDYFNKPVPKIVHQIWFGEQSQRDKSKTDQWEAYCKALGYQYRLWTENDMDYLKTFIDQPNYDLFCWVRWKKNYWSASDIVRYEILKEMGGIYVDCDILPPTDNGSFVDLDLILNLKGLTLWTEHHARNINTSGIFVGNSFIMSPPNHPVLVSVTNQICENANHWYEVNKDYNPMFVTGPFLLNKVLSGSVNIVPITYMKKFNCY